MTTTTTTTTTTLLLLWGVLPAALASPAQQHTSGRDSWGDEFCRVRFCAVMTEQRQDQCCSAYHQCCAYVSLRANQGPFAFREPGEVTATRPDPHPDPDPDATTFTTTFNPREVNPGLPTPLRRTGKKPLPILSQISHHHHHHHHHPHHSTAPPRPAVVLLGHGEDLMKTSYNDQLVKNYKRLCVSSFCGLMSASQHKLCCSTHDQCCTYSNYRQYFDPFHPENEGRRR